MRKTQRIRPEKTQVYKILLENSFGLGTRECEIVELLFWLMHLPDGMSGNAVVRLGKIYSAETKRGIRESRLVALKRLYAIRSSTEFCEHFKKYI